MCRIAANECQGRSTRRNGVSLRKKKLLSIDMKLPISCRFTIKTLSKLPHNFQSCVQVTIKAFSTGIGMFQSILIALIFLLTNNLIFKKEEEEEGNLSISQDSPR